MTHVLAALAVAQLAFGGQRGRLAVHIDVPVEVMDILNGKKVSLTGLTVEFPF